MGAPGHLLSLNKITLCENTKGCRVWPIDAGWGPVLVNRYILSDFTGFNKCHQDNWFYASCVQSGKGPRATLLIYLQPILLIEKFGITDAFTILHLWQTPFL